MLQACVFRSTSPPGPCDRLTTGYHSPLENGNPSPGRMLKKSACGVLASFRPSTYPRGYASALHSLRPCWTNFLSILRKCFPVVICAWTIEVLAYQNIFPRPARPGVGLLPNAHEQSPFPAELERPMEGSNDQTEKHQIQAGRPCEMSDRRG